MTNIWLRKEEMTISDVDMMATSNPFKPFRSNFIWPTCFFPLLKCYFLVTFGNVWWRLVTSGDDWRHQKPRIPSCPTVITNTIPESLALSFEIGFDLIKLALKLFQMIKNWPYQSTEMVLNSFYRNHCKLLFWIPSGWPIVKKSNIFDG